MKAVLGFLFIFSGLGVGYLVLSGKFPASSDTTATGSSLPTDSQINSRYRDQNKATGTIVGGVPSTQHGGGPDLSPSSLGIPAFVYGLDMPASRGMS